MSERKAFNFYKSYFDVFNELPEEEKLTFIKALLNKQFYGIEPELCGMAKFAYISQKAVIEQQIKGWQDKTGNVLSSPSQGGYERDAASPYQQEKGKEEVNEKNNYKDKENESLIQPKNFKDFLLSQKNLIEQLSRMDINIDSAISKFVETEILGGARNGNDLRLHCGRWAKKNKQELNGQSGKPKFNTNR